MINTERLEILGKDMEGGINPILSKIYYRMRKLEIGWGIIAGNPYIPKDNPSLEIIALENN